MLSRRDATELKIGEFRSSCLIEGLDLRVVTVPAAIDSYTCAGEILRVLGRNERDKV